MSDGSVVSRTCRKYRQRSSVELFPLVLSIVGRYIILQAWAGEKNCVLAWEEIAPHVNKRMRGDGPQIHSSDAEWFLKHLRTELIKRERGFRCTIQEGLKLRVEWG